ncbi:MR_MLE domain-containing protein [Candidatus Nitrotoga sp. BS]|uniref:enolase C-terminal domain-like protein n=1 Tax=Candidatus Nitrotoga sp. BS TaxID=2890408 RepID=UPI001EF35396|nr:enolase C-terminal domain-like protein [Candidatus Nitrotoga sp. BS]CAH1204516.1 MR_MLE domain-containing protein [Candidatus Nitrotoga sp. BS]
MKIERLEAICLEIPFKTNFKHASADRAKTASVWIEACSNHGALIGYGEGCPREYVTGENMKSAFDWINRYKSTIVNDITNLESLKAWVVKQEQVIDKDPAAWCAIELALLDLLGKSEGLSLESLLSLPPTPPVLKYSAVLGDNDLAVFSKQVSNYVSVGFRDFKIKLSGDLERDLKKIECLLGTGEPVRIRGDANNLWRNPLDVINYIDQLGQPFWAIEEPLVSRDFSGLSKVAYRTGIKIILDESFTCAQDIHDIKDMANHFVLNFRVSKLGGLIRSIALLKIARSFGLPLIIGAHVGETSVLSRAGITLASAAGDATVAREGAFGTHLLEHDVCEPPVMFGNGGMLRPEEWHFQNAAGNGLEIRTE